MNEHNLRKNVLFTLSGYLIYLIILAFFEKHNNYDLSQCSINKARIRLRRLK